MFHAPYSCSFSPGGGLCRRHLRSFLACSTVIRTALKVSQYGFFSPPESPQICTVVIAGSGLGAGTATLGLGAEVSGAEWGREASEAIKVFGFERSVGIVGEAIGAGSVGLVGAAAIGFMISGAGSVGFAISGAPPTAF